LIAAFDRDATPYKAIRRARFQYKYDDYAHLARVAEWSAETDEEDVR
jgi:ATP-dependent helicase/nuclease subunit B